MKKNISTIRNCKIGDSIFHPQTKLTQTVKNKVHINYLKNCHPIELKGWVKL